MSEFGLPKAILDRVIARRGRLHIFDEIDPVRAALLVIDMQNAYLEEGAPGFVPAGRSIVSTINRLAHAMRAAGAAVVWLRNTLGARTLESWSTYGYFRTGQMRERMLAALEEGASGHQIWDGMDVRPEDLIIDKRRYSAFIAGSSDLDTRLRERGLDTLLITGVLANVCCESTARDAMMLDYKVVMIADGMAAHSEEELRSTFANTLFVFGDVVRCDQAVRLLDKGVR